MKALLIDNFVKRDTNPVFTQIWLENGYTVVYAANFTELNQSMKNESIAYQHIDFIRNPFNPKNIRAYKQLLLLLKKDKYDFVHCKSPISGILGRLCGKQAKIPKIIYSVHGFHFYKGAPFINRTLYKWAEMWLAHYSDAIITINHEDYEAAQKFKLRRNGKAFYIPGAGVDTQDIKAAMPKRDELLELIKADDASVILISVGELNNNKNNKVVIEALGELQNPNIHYVLCGVGDEENELITLAKDKKIKGNVHFLGYRFDVKQLLKSSDIFVMASFREGLPRSMMEAMAAGLPCIASEIRGITDLLEDGEGGFLCNPADIKSYAKNIHTLAADKTLRKSMGVHNLEKIKQFDIENVKSEMKKIYGQILS